MDPTFTWNLDKLSKNQIKIANFIENDTKRIPFLTEQEIADELNISIASVSRFWKAAGFRNLKDFKKEMMAAFDITPAYKMKSLIDKVEGDDLPSNMLSLGQNYLSETSAKLARDDFSKAVHAIRSARHVYLFAQGSAAGLGQLLEYRISRYGVLIRNMCSEGEQLFDSLMHANEKDLVIIFNFSKVLPETTVILDYARKANYQCLLITDLLVSEILEQADMVLYSYRGQIHEFHSMVAPTMLVESLIVGVGSEEKDAALQKLEHLAALRKAYTALLRK